MCIIGGSGLYPRLYSFIPDLVKCVFKHNTNAYADHFYFNVPSLHNCSVFFELKKKACKFFFFYVNIPERI